MNSDGAGPQINGIPTWPDRQGHGTGRLRAEQSVECKLPSLYRVHTDADFRDPVGEEVLLGGPTVCFSLDSEHNVYNPNKIKYSYKSPYQVYER